MQMTRLGVVAIAGLLVGCAHSVSTFDEVGLGADGGPPGAPGQNDGGIGFHPSDGGVTTGPTGAAVLYAHSSTTLYKLDPESISTPMQLIGDFDCIGYHQSASSMTDLAVGKDGKLYGVSEAAAYPLSVQNGVVHCDATWTLPANTKFYGLTMAPENTVQATEVLIAANGAGQLFQIDANTGTPTQVGTLGIDPQSGQPWSLSGDVVFLANNGNPVGFATVRVCTGSYTCSPVDTVIEVDVAAIKPGTQSVLKSIRGPAKSSSQTFGSMFGIVAYKDKVIGFSSKGDIVSISNVDGTATLISNQPSVKFAGAGISTLAPVVAPPN